MSFQAFDETDAEVGLTEQLRTLREQSDLVTDAVVYADPDLLRAVVDAGPDACRVLSIPGMKVERLAAIRSACHSHGVSLSGIDLIAAGAIARASLSAADYGIWLGETVASLTRD